MASEHGTFQKQVTPLLAEMEASANAHNTDRHLAVYSRESALIFVLNGEIIHGWDNLHEKQRQWWNDGKASGVYQYIGEPICELLDEDLGLTTSIIGARASVPDGKARERKLVFTALWRRRQDGWRIIYAHESSKT